MDAIATQELLLTLKHINRTLAGIEEALQLIAGFMENPPQNSR